MILYGFPARSLNDISRLRTTGFDFSEIAIENAGARRMWWESGLMNGGMGKFFLMAHGPLEDHPNDLGYLWSVYLPNLVATVDTLNRMSIRSLNIHLLMDTRMVSGLVLTEKKRALRELVDYGQKNSVDIVLENLSETDDDLEKVLEDVPCLGLTLDVGHADLHAAQNKTFSIMEKVGKLIRHVHLHDNVGGKGHADDLHLPIGNGMVDFAAIVTSLRGAGYDGTMTLEVKPEFHEASLARIKCLVGEVS